MSSHSMHSSHSHAGAHDHDHVPSQSVFGFWAYLMTDCVLFAAFAMQTVGGPRRRSSCSI